MPSTPLGALIYEYRLKNGENGKLQKLAKLADSLKNEGWPTASSDYVSKVQNGGIRNPSPQFLAALARVTVRTHEEISALAARSDGSPQPGVLHSPVFLKPFRIACGHSLWSAPLFWVAQNKWASMFQVSSFADSLGDTGITAGNLCWITEGALETPRPNSPLKALSSANVIELLRRNEIEVGALPGNVAADETDLVRVATLVDSVAGCTFVCPKSEIFNKWMKRIGGHNSRAGTLSGLVASTRDLNALLIDLREKHKSIRVGVEESTVGFVFLRDVCSQSNEGTDNDLSIQELKWHLLTRELTTKPFKTLRDECKEGELVGVIVWEPHASWMKLLAGGQLESVALHLSPSPLGRPQHYSYELVIRRAISPSNRPRKQELVNEFQTLLEALQIAARLLNGIELDRARETLLMRLAKYYGFFDLKTHSPQPEQLLSAIGNILYSVRLTVDGYLFLQSE